MARYENTPNYYSSIIRKKCTPATRVIWDAYAVISLSKRTAGEICKLF